MFAAAFRRPILSALEDVFLQFKHQRGTQKPTPRVVDEMTCMVGLVPMAFTCVRAPIYRKLSATDASPTGAGSCTATQLKRRLGTPNPQVVWCLHLPLRHGRGHWKWRGHGVPPSDAEAAFARCTAIKSIVTRVSATAKLCRCSARGGLEATAH